MSCSTTSVLHYLGYNRTVNIEKNSIGKVLYCEANQSEQQLLLFIFSYHNILLEVLIPPGLSKLFINLSLLPHTSQDFRPLATVDFKLHGEINHQVKL